MTRVFLSYHREDESAAGLIACALERAGHSVWWDRNIKGGTQYSEEIERELEGAEAVIVLWSPSSVKSAWVRDEAGSGRDNGRLVPITLRKTSPPMGFRQYQSIDLTRWKGRGEPPLGPVLAALDDFHGTTVGNGSDAGRTKRIKARRFQVRSLALAVLIAALLIAGLLIWRPWHPAEGAPTVAVVPVDSNQTAKALAADLLVKLDVLQSSHADALQLIDSQSEGKPDFVIKVGGADSSTGVRANLLLVENQAGTILWSSEFTASSGLAADLRQQMAYSAAKVLECAVQALAPEAKVETPTLKLYLSGCANISNLLARDPKAAIAIFEKVVERSPRFKGAWKKLLLAEIQVIRTNRTPNPTALTVLQDRIEQARRLDQSIAEAYIAEGYLQLPGSLTRWIDLIQKAAARDPDNPDVLAFQSLAHSNVGLMQEALNDAHRAVKSDPLSPAAREGLITALLNSDQVEAAKNELKNAEQLWPGTTSVLQAKFQIEFRAGDAKLALAMLKSNLLGPRYLPRSPKDYAAHESYLKARIEPSARNKMKAIIEARALYAEDPGRSWALTRALSEFGAIDELIEFLLSSNAVDPSNTTWTLFRPSFWDLHRDRRFMRVAARFGLIDYWRTSKKWPDFCSRSDLPYNCKAEAAALTS